MEEFLVDLNGTAAAERAGYRGSSIAITASKLRNHPAIKARIAEAQAARAERVEKRLSTTILEADRVLEEVARLAFADPVGAFNDNGTLKALKDMPEEIRRSISGVDVRSDGEGGQIIKVRFWDKTKAIEMTMRHLGLFRDKVEVSREGGAALTIEVRTYRDGK